MLQDTRTELIVMIFRRERGADARNAVGLAELPFRMELTSPKN